jgi:hypothetical protein
LLYNPTKSASRSLAAEACGCGADLLFAGAFGHPRLWEKMLGGVAHDLMARMSLPLSCRTDKER